IEELDVPLREQSLRLQADQVFEESRRVLFEELFRPREGVSVPEADRQAEAFLSEAVAAVHVGFEVLGVHLVWLDPVSILHEGLEGLRSGPLLEESRRKDRTEFATRRGVQLADHGLGIETCGAEEFQGGLRASRQAAEVGLDRLGEGFPEGLIPKGQSTFRHNDLPLDRLPEQGSIDTIVPSDRMFVLYR